MCTYLSIYLSTWNGILLSHKKEWNNSICSYMDEPRDYYTSEVNQVKTNTIWYHLYVESKIWHNWTYLWNRNRLTDIENRPVVAKGEGGRGGMDWEFGISKCKLLYIAWINNQVLLYSTGNYIQYPIVNHNGKKYEKEYKYIYIYIKLNHFAVHWKLTQHCM